MLNGEVLKFDVRDESLKRSQTSFTGCGEIRFSPDGSRFLLMRDKNIEIWGTEIFEPLVKLEGFSRGMASTPWIYSRQDIVIRKGDDKLVLYSLKR